MSNVSTGDIAMVVDNTKRHPCMDAMQGFVFKVGGAISLNTGPGWHIDGSPVRCLRCQNFVFTAFLDADLQRLRPPADSARVALPESLSREVAEGIAHG